MSDTVEPIEILAPAGSPESLKAALNTGADAVYLGLNPENSEMNGFSARRNAKNFTAEELYEAASVCRLSGVKLYIALNTLLFDDEREQAKYIVKTAIQAGADAFIIQDLSLLSLIEEVEEAFKSANTKLRLHASTQMTITSVSGVLEAKKLGFSRVVLARELSFPEIAEITESAKIAGIETEVFVHGALCVCLSGQCYMSAFFKSGKSASSEKSTAHGKTDIRSANRGLCAQPCRLNFTVGEIENALSLKELSIIGNIKKLESAGVKSIKIEGRMKRPEYVAAAVDACYRERSVDLRAENLPSAHLSKQAQDSSRLKSVFSRGGFTDGYFTGNTTLMRGFRGREDVLQTESVLKELRDLYKEPFKRRKLNIKLIIKSGAEILCHTYCDKVTATLNFPSAEPALTRQTTAEEVITRLSKLGGTIFSTGEIICETEDGLFLSAARINEIRRKIIAEISEKLSI